MKYKVGDIVLLYDGKTVYILSIDKGNNHYQAIGVDDESVMEVNDEDIYMKVV